MALIAGTKVLGEDDELAIYDASVHQPLGRPPTADNLRLGKSQVKIELVQLAAERKEAKW